MALSATLPGYIQALGTGTTVDKALAFIERLDNEQQLQRLLAAAKLCSETEEEAFTCMAHACLEIANLEVSNRISRSTLKGTPYESLHRAIRELHQGKLTGPRLMQHRSCGLISHQVATRICQHAPYDSAKTVSPLQPAFWDRRPLLTKERHVRLSYVNSVKRALDQALKYFPTQNKRFANAVNTLALALEPAIGTDIFLKFKPEKVASFRLYALTIMSWAQLFLATANEYAHLMITEIEVTEGGYWVDGGRIDALCPVQANGDKLPLKQRIAFRQAIHKRPRNAVELIKRLPKVGATQFFRVDDYKFQVGDAKHDYRELNPEEVLHKPLPGHLEQIQHYMSLLSVAYREARGLNRTPWDLPVAREGRLIYIFADRPPVIYSITMTGKEKKRLRDSYQEQRDELAAKSETARRAHKVVKKMKPVQNSFF
jgi:hypothetical protein